MSILPGKTQDALKHAKVAADYLSAKTPVTSQVAVFLEVLGDVGKLHMILEYENLAGYEQSLAALRGIPGAKWIKILQSGEEYFVPGTTRDLAMVAIGAE